MSTRYGEWTNIWSRGTDFDVIVTKTLFQSLGEDFNQCFKFAQSRDIRTYLDTLSGFDKIFRNNFIPPDCKDVNFEAHNSIHDIAMDVMRMQFMTRLIYMN